MLIPTKALQPTHGSHQSAATKEYRAKTDSLEEFDPKKYGLRSTVTVSPTCDQYKVTAFRFKEAWMRTGDPTNGRFFASLRGDPPSETYTGAPTTPLNLDYKGYTPPIPRGQAIELNPRRNEWMPRVEPVQIREMTAIDIFMMAIDPNKRNPVIEGHQVKNQHFDRINLSLASARTPLDRRVIRGCTFINVSFRGANLENIDWVNCMFQNCSFDGAKMKYATATRIYVIEGYGRSASRHLINDKRETTINFALIANYLEGRNPNEHRTVVDRRTPHQDPNAAFAAHYEVLGASKWDTLNGTFYLNSFSDRSDPTGRSETRPSHQDPNAARETQKCGKLTDKSNGMFRDIGGKFIGHVSVIGCVDLGRQWPCRTDRGHFA